MGDTIPGSCPCLARCHGRSLCSDHCEPISRMSGSRHGSPDPGHADQAAHRGCRRRSPPAGPCFRVPIAPFRPGQALEARGDQPVIGPSLEFEERFQILGPGHGLEGVEAREKGRDQPVRPLRRSGQSRHEKTISVSRTGSNPASAPGPPRNPPRQASRFRRTVRMPSSPPPIITSSGA